MCERYSVFNVNLGSAVRRVIAVFWKFNINYALSQTLNVWHFLMTFETFMTYLKTQSATVVTFTHFKVSASVLCVLRGFLYLSRGC